MATGWIYVLVNSSMPGLVKVGKTTRDSEQRADELSSVTGVATPFMVAFQQHFVDCDAAEQFVHVRLQECGFREWSNREFFRARPNEVIRIVMTAPGACDEGQEERLPSQNEDDDLLSPESADDDLRLQGYSPPKPYDGLLGKADAYFFGTGDTIQDYAEALDLYKDAARLGSPLAYEHLRTIYQYGKGVPENCDKALKYYKEGAKKGIYYCYSCMSTIFYQYENRDNFRKSISLFLHSRIGSPLAEVEDYDGKYVQQVWNIIQNCLDLDLSFEHTDLVQTTKPDLLKHYSWRAKKGYSSDLQERDTKTRNWMLQNLQTPVEQRPVIPTAGSSRWPWRR
jgi:hypothetical protein